MGWRSPAVLHSARWCQYDMFGPERQKNETSVFVKDISSPSRPSASLPSATPVIKAQSPEKKSQQGAAALIMKRDKDREPTQSRDQRFDSAAAGG